MICLIDHNPRGMLWCSLEPLPVKVGLKRNHYP